MHVKSPHGTLEIPQVSLNDFFLSRINEYGDEIALIDNAIQEGRQLTFRQLYRQIELCGRYFQKQDIKKGDVVGLVIPNCLEYVTAIISVISSGTVISPCNSTYSEGELEHIYKITEPKILIVSDECISVVKRVLEHVKSVKKIIVIGKSDEFDTWDEVIADNEDTEETHRCEISPKEDLAILPYSSGTTGMPKCVMHTHYSIIAILLSSWHHFGYKRGDVYYNERPMFHGGGFMFVMAALQGGVKVVMDRGFDIERFLSDIQKYKVNHMFIVPPNMMELSQTDLHQKYDTSSWKSSITGGATIPPTVMKTVIDRFNIKVTPAYAMTECCPLAWNDNGGLFVDSVGSICLNLEMKIIDSKTQKELKSEETGEILVKGPQRALGYYKNEEATKQAINEDGFLHTGDIGYIKNNMLYVVGRIKEVIKYKTLQVAPSEIENVLLRHPGVKDVGVVGVPDPVCEELPKAFIVRKLESITADELHEFVKSELADYKQLRGGIQFVSEIPKSKLGKIDRKELKKLAMK